MHEEDAGSARSDGFGSHCTGRLVMSLQVTSELAFDVDVRLRYDPADPYAVQLTFHLPGDPPVNWVFARELLLDGISRSTGEGDIVIEPVPGQDPDFQDVRIRLRSPAGEAVLYSPALPLIAFLGRTDRLLPMGHEQTVSDLDTALELILDGHSRRTG
jgi:Streptomyces sporulation and cell division protein, SsgA